jgi:hypothetical protein
MDELFLLTILVLSAEGRPARVTWLSHAVPQPELLLLVTNLVDL